MVRGCRTICAARSPRVAIVPTASAPEGDRVFDRWARLGLEHYRGMGIEAAVVPLKTRADAEREDVATTIADASMVFFSGGNPRYLAETIDGSRFWSVLEAALVRGSVFAGCSAGAMVAGRRPESRPRFGATWVSGLGLVPSGSFGAHWDRMRFIPGMRGFVMARARGGWFAGIDERTAILGDGSAWRVYGLGGVSLRLDGRTRRIRSGEAFRTT